MNYLPLQEFIDEDIRLSDEEKKKRKHSDCWYASELGYCPRKSFFRRLELPPDKPLDARTLRVFAVGKRDEEFVLDRVVKKVGKKVGETTIVKAEREVQCRNDVLGVHGRIDLYVQYANNQEEIIEAKSQNSKSFSYMVGAGEGPNKAHTYQLWFYLYTKQVERGQLVYVSKDDLRIVQYPIMLKNPEIGDNVLKRVSYLNEMWEKKQLPPSCKDWQCRYCNYAQQCKKVKSLDDVASVKEKITAIK